MDYITKYLETAERTLIKKIADLREEIYADYIEQWVQNRKEAAGVISDTNMSYEEKAGQLGRLAKKEKDLDKHIRKQGRLLCGNGIERLAELQRGLSEIRNELSCRRLRRAG
ncbi:MAG TPA: hypothetical protein PLX02_12170 [Syntrophorhabdaceae bacterium]|mgnify:CR=1 FL=1|nr:hypothetical protein [Syntrophorhabdaceae bacterium]HQM82368.1 hypothetical protein [Syntrophorhabdaceae bacterium]